MQNRKILFSLLFVCTGAGATFHALARQTPPKPVTGSKTEQKKEDVKDEKKERWANLEASDWKHEEKTGIGTGRNFRYTEDDMVVTGDSVRYNQDKKLMWATGNLVMDDAKYHITGGKADVDHGKKKLAIITENVVIVLKPKEEKSEHAPVGLAKIIMPPAANAPTVVTEQDDTSVGKERRRGITITCDRVESLYKKKNTIMRGHLVFKQQIKKNGKTVERTLTAEHAEYNGNAEKMVLFHPVEGRDSDGQETKWEKDVTIGTKEGEETLESTGRIKIRTSVSDEDDEEKPEKP